MPFKIGLLRRMTLRKHHGANKMTEEDGTQIERSDHMKKKKGTIRKGDSPEMVEHLREFCLEASKTGVQASIDSKLRCDKKRWIESTSLRRNGVRDWFDEDMFEGLVKEFMEIKKSTPPPAQLKKVAFDGHANKNRYKDVYCTDETRVALTYPEGAADDYIHANYVDIRETKHRFICTQAPKENTLEDFWRMVWQEKSKAIVMLCNITECGKKKCEQYWPPKQDETQTYGTLTVKNTKVVQAEKMLTISNLEVSNGSDPPLVCEHMFWNNWPDRGVPENYLACFRLLTRLKPLTHIIVHCSAGIGRTGTVVGLEMALQAFQAGEKVSLCEIVKELRRQRPGSVQTDVQYVYMHRCLMGLSENKKAIKHAEMTSFFEQFDQLLKIRGCVLTSPICPTITARGNI